MKQINQIEEMEALKSSREESSINIAQLCIRDTMLLWFREIIRSVSVSPTELVDSYPVETIDGTLIFIIANEWGNLHNLDDVIPAKEYEK